MLKHYVEIFYLGKDFLYETTEEEVPQRISKLVKIPEEAIGYRFFDRYEWNFKDQTFVGIKKNFSRMTYYGKAYTLEEVEAYFPECENLIHNMKSQGYSRVVKTRAENWQFLKEGDIVKS